MLLKGVPQPGAFSHQCVLLFCLFVETNSVRACQAAALSAQMVCDLVSLLELKPKGSRKLAQKRRRAAANILHILSKHGKNYWPITWMILLYHANFFLLLQNLDEGRRLIIDACGLQRLYAFVLAAPDDKPYDNVVHKIGQTILRSAALRDLPGHANSFSAYVSRAFGPVSPEINCKGMQMECQTDEFTSCSVARYSRNGSGVRFERRQRLRRWRDIASSPSSQLLPQHWGAQAISLSFRSSTYWWWRDH